MSRRLLLVALAVAAVGVSAPSGAIAQSGPGLGCEVPLDRLQRAWGRVETDRAGRALDLAEQLLARGGSCWAEGALLAAAAGPRYVDLIVTGPWAVRFAPPPYDYEQLFGFLLALEAEAAVRIADAEAAGSSSLERLEHARSAVGAARFQYDLRAAFCVLVRPRAEPPRPPPPRPLRVWRRPMPPHRRAAWERLRTKMW